MRYTIAQETRVGNRKSNQDRLGHRASRESILLVVADGMGGHAHGELAAQVTVELMLDAFEAQARPRLSDPFLFLTRVFAEAHEQIGKVAERRGLPDIPRTTCVACVIQDSIAYWAHAGDSRLYLIRNGQLQGQTRDHTRVRQLLDQGLITPEMAPTHPERNKLFSCLGGVFPPQVDYSHKTPLFPGDVLLLGSDGAWGPMETEHLIRFASQQPPAEGLKRLLDEAEQLARGESDNLSAIVLQWAETRNGPGVSETPSDEDIEHAIDEIRGLRHA